MKRIFKTNVFLFILCFVLLGSIGVFASQVLATGIKYKDTTVENAMNDLYSIANLDLSDSETFSNYVTNSKREINNIVSLSNLNVGEYICSSYYAASSYEDSSTRGSITTYVTYEIDGCSAINEYDVNGHWNAAKSAVSSGVYTSTVTKDVRFYCKIENDNDSISINYHPKSRTDECSVSLYLTCTKIR